MCVVTADVYECDSPECAAQGLDRMAVVRRQVAALLRDAPVEGVVDAMLIVNLLMECSYQHGRRPVRLRVQRLIADDHLWVDVYGCPVDVADVLTVVDREVLNAICGSWGVVPGTPDYTLWADLSLRPDHATGPWRAGTSSPPDDPRAA